MSIHKTVESPSVRPSLLLDFANSKSVDDRLTFTRSSTASYYDGVTKHISAQNMIRRSQDFSTSHWTYSYASITASGLAAPDGTATAIKMAESTTATQTHSIAQTASNAIKFIGGQPYTFSVYAKAVENDWILLDLTQYNVINQRCWFNISNGTLGTMASGCTGSTQDVGNGWYRCMVTCTIATVGQSWAPQIITANANNARHYGGTVGNGMLIWGAQLQKGSVATPLLQTQQEPILQHQPTLLTKASGEPRIDHNASTGECLGLLVEEQRINQIPRSVIGPTGWNFTNCSRDGYDIAPNGTTEAVVVRPDGAGTHFFLYNSQVNQNTVYTFSIYVKAAGLNHVQIASSTGFVSGFRNFNLDDLTVGSSDIGEQGAQEGIEDVGNGWRRIWVTETATGTSASGRFAVQGIPNATTSRLAFGSGANPYKGISYWGAQMEVGKGRTSHIPTSGSSVTRAAEICEMSNIGTYDWYNRDEGTLYSEFAVNLFNTSQGIVSMYSTDYGNDWMGFYSNAPNADGTSAITIAAYQASPASAIAGGQTIRLENGVTNKQFEIGQTIQAALSYGPTAFRSAGDGHGLETTGTRHGPDHDILSLHKLYQNGFNGKAAHIKKVAFYPRQMTVVELEEMTEH